MTDALSPDTPLRALGSSMGEKGRLKRPTVDSMLLEDAPAPVVSTIG